MGGYASTPRKTKTSEDGSDGTVQYAASGMQGWRASMEDAHIVLMKVPPGKPPSAAEIGAARIGTSPRASYASLSNQASLDDGRGQGHAQNLAASLLRMTPAVGSAEVNGCGARARAFTYPAGDAVDPSLPALGANEDAAPASEASHAGGAQEGVGSAGTRRESTGNRRRGPEAGRSGSAASGVITSTEGTAEGWKAVDLLEDAALFGVFDGHGGKAVAEFCRDRLPGLLAASPEIRAGNWKTGFPQVFHTLDRMLATGEGQGKVGGWGAASKVDGVGVGSTIVTALLDRKRGQCYVAHAGDSRCVLCRAGRAVQLTKDHKPRLPAEYARIVAAGGHVSRVGRVNDNLNLSRAIGDMAYKRNRLRDPKDQIISAEPDVCRFAVTPGVDEFLLLACDGVWEIMNTSEVVAFVRAGLRAGAAPREVCENLLNACLSPDPRGTRYAGCDNMTVVLVLLEGWEGALTSRSRPRAATYSGERPDIPSVASSATSSKFRRVPRRDSEPRRPASGTLGAVKREESAPPQSGTRGPAVPSARAETSAAAVETKMELPQQAAGGPQKELPSDSALHISPIARERNGANGSRGMPRRLSEADSTTLLAHRMRAEAASGWSLRRLSVNGISRPSHTQGIEFSLASFSAPIVPYGQVMSAIRPVLHRSSASSSVIAVATAAGARPRNSGSSYEGTQSNSRRRSGHLRSATAPMLPSPLIHLHRRSPSDERISTGGVSASMSAARASGPGLPAPLPRGKNVAVRSGVATLDAAVGASAQAPAPVAVVSTDTGTKGDQSPTAGKSEDVGVSLVFVPPHEGLSSVDVTVPAGNSECAPQNVR